MSGTSQKLLAVAVSGAVSIAVVAGLGPRIGLFEWSAAAPREAPPAAAPAAAPGPPSEPTPDAPAPEQRPAWVEQSIAALEAEISRIQGELAAARQDTARYRAGLERARAQRESLEARIRSRRARPPAAPPPPQRQAPPAAYLGVSGCSMADAPFGKTEFSFWVRNSGRHTVDVLAAVYLIEHDTLLGPQSSLVARVPLELAPREEVHVVRSWALTDTSPDLRIGHGLPPEDEQEQCEVRLELP